MKIYENAEDIKADLELYRLKRDISLEELKLVKQNYKDDLAVASWIPSILKYVGKYGLFRIFKKVI